ncbi:Pycsar system effector family protein [Kitasatospora sp. NPDC088134]|uniref:Pycsar system effector family protein n=1 Tax=Kitasatospora sp. NPDC088134 TaxID=3364071 RepID=UPI003815AA22
MDTATAPAETPDAAGITEPARPTTPLLLAPEADRDLERAHATTLVEVGRTDTKAGLLLALDAGIAATGVAAAALGAIPRTALVPVAAGVLTLAAAAVLALLAVMPRLRPAPEPPCSTWATDGDRPGGGFLRWARCTGPDDLLRALAEEDRLHTVNRLSRLAERKYQLLAWSVGLDIATVAAITAAALLALATH